MAEHVPGDWEPASAAYDAGLRGSRGLMELEVSLMPSDPSALVATAAAQPHDPGFVAFVERAGDAGVPVEVVSDGFGFFIGPALVRLGLPDLPVVTAVTTFAPGRTPRIEFPNGHPDCHVCGTCKRERVLAYQRAGRAVIFIGDGESDRYAAGYADIVFAKRALVPICVANGWPFRRWTEFSEIEAWLADTIAAWRGDPSAVTPPARRSFFCGPEVWGDGRSEPPWPAGLPGRGPAAEGEPGAD
jgi:2-hydroxy-3-keto-5-methylthiopentenyl-1-phosphate phosphatase